MVRGNIKTCPVTSLPQRATYASSTTDSSRVSRRRSLPSHHLGNFLPTRIHGKPEEKRDDFRRRRTYGFFSATNVSMGERKPVKGETKRASSAREMTNKGKEKAVGKKERKKGGEHHYMPQRSQQDWSSSRNTLIT